MKINKEKSLLMISFVETNEIVNSMWYGILKEKNKMNNLYLIYVLTNMIEEVEDSKLDLLLTTL